MMMPNSWWIREFEGEYAIIRPMEKIATSTYSFAKLRRAGYVYVDKTDLLWRLVSETEDSQFFISRPRRFGKSLMLSTLKCIFEGKRELFMGLKIDKLKYDWKKYPVVHLDMSKVNGETPDKLEAVLLGMVLRLAEQFRIRLTETDRATSEGAFCAFLDRLGRRRKPYVVLVDEYDVPLQGFFGNRAAILRVRKLLHDFYINLKNHEGDIRFLMLTGVTKLTKVSVFSGLNHLTDLTMKKADYAALLGYTPKEIMKYFPRGLDELAKTIGTNRAGALQRLLDWYDSYRFSHRSEERVCNPISIGQAISNRALEGYWVGTAMATLVMERIAAAGKTPDDFEGCTASVDELDLCDALTLPAKSLMYQSGYLTIKGLSKTEVDGVGNPKLILGAPNHEVRGAIRDGWFSSIIKVPATEFDALVDIAKRQIAAGDIRGLLYESLFGLYAKLPPTWRVKDEAEAKRYFLLFMQMAGANPQPERASLLGYADAIIETKKFVWVFEFKFNKSANAAIRQIREKGYAAAYKGDRRPVTLVGINFRTAKRNIDEPVFGKMRG